MNWKKRNLLEEIINNQTVFLGNLVKCSRIENHSVGGMTNSVFETKSTVLLLGLN